ncbi:unnamed protein product [Ceutorhynchus assimilis]|uniref:Uncharacterized protein n=1 Tax=Ceutorhynchus assimilis TaxID=467358 RepID=A0A9N9MY03_9CUCU|nr:unnamed protein product [Ceutorhynchus assimilis]
MNQDTGWFNSYDKCGPDQRNHPPPRYNNAATMPQPPRWDPLCLPPPVGIGHNIQSLHPYAGGFVPNQFHPAYTPRPMGSYQTYMQPKPSYNNYRNNQNPRMRQGNNRWQRRNGQDRSRNNYQHSNPGPSKQEPQIQEIEQTIPPPVETQLDKRPATTVSPASVHIIEDNNDNVGADKRKIKEEDKKLLMECIDLSAETDSPEEALNRFEFESRTKILDKLCGTTDEAKFIEGLKQFKMILKDQMCGIRLKNQLSKMLLKYILFLGMNYKSLASGFIEEYLDLMEDIIAMFCQVVTDIINLRLADNKRTLNDVFASQIKQLISCALLCRLDSIMHCLFKVHIPPLLKDHSALWTDVFLYFLRKSKFDPKHDDLLRLFIAWKRLLSVRASKDAEIINGYMFECLKKTPEELKSIPYLKEFMENYHDNPRCNWQEMLSKYWKWWKEERPEQLWAGLEEPTYIQLHGTFNLEYQPTNNVFTNHSKTQDDEFSKLFEDRLTGKTLGLTQLGRRMPYGRQNNLFCQSTSGNIFDEATCINIDFDYYDDNDLIIAEPKVVETVVVDSDDDDDDVVFIEEESTAKEVVEKTTDAVEELNINDLNENIFEDDSNKVDEELILNSKTSLEVEVQPDNEASENNPKETDDSKSNVAVEEIISNYHEASKNNPKETAESKNNVVVEEICDNFIKNYPEDIDDDDDSVDFPEIIIESERNQDNLPSNAMTLDEIFDEWEETFDDIGPEMERNEDRTLMFADPLNEGEGNDPFKSPLHSPEECNDKDNTEKTCDEFSKTETVSSQKEIVPEKRTDSIPDDIEELPNQQQELESIAKTPVSTNQQQETIAETSASSKHNGLLSILCMQDLRQVLNEMEQDDRKLQEKLNEEKNVCLTEVPAAIEENVIEQQLTDEEDNLDKSHNYAAIVQAACSDDDNNEFASKGLNLFEHQSDATNDSDEISSPPFEPLDSNEAHVDSENESFEKERRFEAIGETLATASTEPVISPAVSGTLATASTEPCQPDTNESCQTVIKDDEVLNETSTKLAGAESTSTTAINLASPCGDNSDNITIHCRFVLKQEVQPDFAAMHENYELEKYADYPLEVPQRPNSPPQSGSQPYSPPSIRIGNTGSALDETSTMLYTPILQDSHKIQPAIVPDVLPQQDLPNHNVVPPEPSVENKLVDTIKILKVHNVVETPSSSSFGKESDDTYIVVRNSQTTEAETPEKPKKRSRKSSTTKDGVKSKKRESDSSRVRKSSRALQDGVKKASKEKLMKPLSPQDNGLFEYAFEGPTGKPLWNTTPNMLWDDSEDHPEAQKTTVLVKSDKQLVSILKKPKLDKQIKDYNQPRLFIRLSTKDRLSDNYDIRAKEIIEDLKKQNNIKNAAEERAREMARLMMMKAQQDKHDFGSILRCNFHEVDEYKRVFSKPRETRKVTFEGVTAEHSYQSYWNGEQTPEKRKRDSYLLDERPVKKTRIKICANPMEERVGHFPIKMSIPHKTVHSKEPKVESTPRGLLATKLNGIIAKKPSKSLSFSNFTEEIPVRLPIIPNGISNKIPSKSLTFTSNNQTKDETPASIPATKKPNKSIFHMEESIVETPVKAPANKKPGKSLSFSEESEIIIESPKRPSKSLAFSDNIIESAAQTAPTKKSCNRLSWFNTGVEIPATTIDLVESSEEIKNSIEEIKIESPISIEAVEESTPVRKKPGRPPGAKNKRFSFTNIKPRVRRSAMCNQDLSLSIKESEVANGICINKEPIALKPKTSRRRNRTQNLAQLRDKTTGNDSCDVTESKPGRRRKANNF